MASLASREEAPDDVLIWRFAGVRAHQAAEAARVKALEAALEERRRHRLRALIAPALRDVGAEVRMVARTLGGVRLRRRRHVALAGHGQGRPSVQPATAVDESTQAAAAPGTVLQATAVEAATPAEAVAPVTRARSGGTAVWTAPPVAAAAADTAAEVSLQELLVRGRTLPLPAALLLYDDVLESLQRLHGEGQTHDGLRTGAVVIDAEGRCSLRQSGSASRRWSALPSPAADARAATVILVDALTGLSGPLAPDGLPLPVRGLVEVGLSAAGAGVPKVARLRLDLAVAAHAFLGDQWEQTGRAWLAAAVQALGCRTSAIATPTPTPAGGAAAAPAAATATAARPRPAPAARAEPVEPEAGRIAPESAEPGAQRVDKRPLVFGGIRRREPRFLIGLGIAASVFVLLVIGTAVGLTGSRPPAQPAPARPQETAPVPSAPPSLVAASPPAAAPTPAQTPAATPPPPTAPPAQAAPLPPSAPVRGGPVTFIPVPLPPPPPSYAPPPTPAPQCLLGIIC